MPTILPTSMALPPPMATTTWHEYWRHDSNASATNWGPGKGVTWSNNVTREESMRSMTCRKISLYRKFFRTVTRKTLACAPTASSMTSGNSASRSGPKITLMGFSQLNWGKVKSAATPPTLRG